MHSRCRTSAHKNLRSFFTMQRVLLPPGIAAADLSAALPSGLPPSADRPPAAGSAPAAALWSAAAGLQPGGSAAAHMQP